MRFEKVSFSIIGGDKRQVKLCNLLIKSGYKVKVFGFSNTQVNPLAKQATSLEEATEGADIIIGPIPCSQNDRDLFARYHDTNIKLEEVIKTIRKKQIFMAGRLTEHIQKILKEYGITYIDLLEREELAIRNAIPTVFASCISL